jgi:hypothetical protein
LIPFYNIIKSYLDEIVIEPSIPRMPKSKLKKIPSKSLHSRETDCPCGFKVGTDEKCGTNAEKHLLRVRLHKKICDICSSIQTIRRVDIRVDTRRRIG